MAVGFSNAAEAYAGGQTSDTLAFPGALTSGSTLALLVAGWRNAQPFVVSSVGDGTQTWSQAPNTRVVDADSGGKQATEIWYFEDNALTSTPTVTLTAGGSQSYFRWGIVEVTGVLTSSVIVDEGTNSGILETAPSVSTTATDAASGDAVLALFTNSNGDSAINAAGGLGTELWIYQDAADIAGEASYETASSGGTQTADWTMDQGGFGASILVLGATGGQTVSPTKDTVTFAGKTPTVTATDNKTTSPTNGDIDFTGFVPTRLVNYIPLPTNGQVNFTGFSPAPAVTDNKTTAPTKGAVSFSGRTPTAEKTENQTVSPSVAQVDFDGAIPSPLTTANQTVTPTVGEVAFTGIVPAPAVTAGQTASPTVGEVAFNGATPTATATANIVKSPIVGELAFAGKIPAIGGDKTSSPSKGVVTFSGQTPVLAANNTASPATGTISFGGFAPTAWLSMGDGDIVIQVDPPRVGVGQITFTGFAPQIGGNQVTTPSKGAVVFSGLTPTAAATDNKTVAPTVGLISFTGFAPTSAVSLSASPNKGTVVFTGFGATVTVSNNLTAAPSLGEIAFTGLTPGVLNASPLTASPTKGFVSFAGFAPSLPGREVAEEETVPGGVGKGRRRRRRLYRLPNGKLVYATPEELRQIAAMYEEEVVDVEPELKSYPRNYRRKQLRKYRTKAVDAPAIIEELEEEADIQFVLKEIAKSLR